MSQFYARLSLSKQWALEKISRAHSHVGVEQSVARWSHTPEVAGSSPAPASASGLVPTAGLLVRLGSSAGRAPPS